MCSIYIAWTQKKIYQINIILKRKQKHYSKTLFNTYSIIILGVSELVYYILFFLLRVVFLCFTNKLKWEE